MAEIFQPVRGTEEAIKTKYQDIHEGYLYFAYDTGNIYIDKDGARYQMGSNSTGIIYANGNDSNIIKADPEDDASTIYLMNSSALENPNSLPQPNSLILNTDGRFFRVLSIDETTKIITVTLLAVSGTGGTGGGGEGPIVTSRDVDITWDIDTISTGRIFIYKQNYNAIFIPTTTAVGDTTCNVTFIINDKENNTTNTIVRNNVENGARLEFDTSILPESSNISLQIVVTSDNSQYNHGLGYQRNITSLKVVRMELEKPFENAYQPLVQSDDLSGTLTLKYRPIGDESLPFTLHTYVDGEEIGNGAPIPVSYLNQIVPVTIERQSHGVHSIQFRMSTIINNTTIYSNTIDYEGAWATPEEETPIIWIGKYDQTIVNYENSYIYYMVFDPVNYANGMPAEVHLYKDGIEVSQIEGNYSEDNWLVWDISNLYTVNENQTITQNNFAIACGGTRVNIAINVTTEGSRSLGLIAPSNLILNMSSAGRSSNEIKRNRSRFLSTVKTDTINATLNNFNWQNNGWKDSDGLDANGVDSGAYLSIANGANLNISMAGNGLILNGSKDYTFELRFRIKNVQEYSTLVKIKPKFFYSVPDENHPGEWLPTYTITTSGEDETIDGPSLFESEIEALGYKIGLDKYGNLLMDEANSIKTTESRKGVVCRWLAGDDDSDVGFCIGTQEAYFRTPSGVVNVRYCENEVINLTMVASKTDRLCYIYLNGILAGAVAMPTGTASGFTVNTPFIFNSNFCDFDLYRFRIYELGLTMPQVIHNYLSDMHSIVLYDQNQITNPLDPTALSYDLLVKYNKDHPNTPTMPYATWQITDGNDELLSYKKGNNRMATVEFVNPPLDEALNKYLAGDIDNGITPWHYYTHCPSFQANNVDLNVQGTSSQKYPRRNYKLKYKSAKDTWLYTKGPLAGYPLTKDYYFYQSSGELVTVEKTNEETGEVSIVPLTDKAGFNSSTMMKLAKKYHMDTEDFGTNKFTWKIDYMESSETYNTGFANLMGNLVHPLYTKHPLDDLNLGIDTSDMRTTVYGFPVLTFHKYANGQYEYIGKYNMNLDKSSNEYYGFEAENAQPYVARRIKKVLNEETNEYEDVEYQPTIAEIAECWELKDNQGNWCSFKYPNAAARQTGFMTLKEGTSGDSAQLELLNHYEYRYSYYADQLDAAYEYTSFTDPNTQITYSNNGQINTYLYEKHKNFEDLFNWLDSTNPDTATNNTLSSPITYQVSAISNDSTVTYTEISSGLWNAIFTADTREYRRQKFKAEFSEHLDKEYCLTYYVLTELLLCYDSRGKNCMLATFGPQRAGGNYIWYPVFYDIDTQLGLNNSGAYLWDYDADVTKDNLFSTPTSVLWNNLYDLFYDDIVQKYRVLRGISNPSNNDSKINGSLTYENIAGAYECNSSVFNSYAMAGVRPIVAVGLDEYYKYLAPALKENDFNSGKLYAGYYDTSGTHKYQATPTYVYACQGDKKLTTELLLRNRLNYIDSWWMGGDYRAGVVENQIFLRGNANLASTSDNFLDSNSLSALPAAATQSAATYSLAPYSEDGEIRNINDYFDAKPGFKIKPFLHQYVSYFHDSQPSIPKKYDGSSEQEDGIWTNVDAQKLEAYKTEVDYSQQILYVPGGDYISSLGDLSLVYANAIQIQHGLRLLDLKLGSDIPGYKNPGLTGRQNTDFELTNMPLLKSVNISKLNRFTDELPELIHSAKLQEFRALGSAIERTNFAPGAPLHTVHLPSTMTTISLVQNQELKKIITSIPEIVTESNGLYTYNDPSTYKGLYIEGVTDYNSASANTGHKISNLEIVGGGLGYNSYIILKNLYDLKKEASLNNTLSIGLTDVVWTPYIPIEKGTEYDSSETYYFLNDHSTYENYNFIDNNTWEKHLNDSLVYIYNQEYTHNEEQIITNLDLLDALIDQYELAKMNRTVSQFSNLVNTTDATIPTITGSLYVSNNSNNKIKETDLTEKYGKYFPYLSISAKFIKESNVTKYVRVYEENGITEIIEALRSDEVHPLPPTKNIPTKAGYDFLGWSTDINGTQMFLKYQIDVNTGNGEYINIEDSMNSYTFDNNNSVLTLYAQYQIHQNLITIKQGEETIGGYLVNNGSVFRAPSQIYKYIDGRIDSSTLYDYIPYKDDRALDFDKTYHFVGYSLSDTDTTTITSPVPDYINKDIIIYTIFEITEVYDNVLTDDSYYSVETRTIDNISYNILYLTDKANSLQGKITLPNKVNGKMITGFNNRISATYPNSIQFSEHRPDNITHIFWERGSELALIGEYACFYWQGLRYFELPNYGTRISKEAFEHTTNLFKDINQTVMDEFFNKITILKLSCFLSMSTSDYNEKGNTNLGGKTINLPNILQVEDTTFAESIVSNIVFGSQENTELDQGNWTPGRGSWNGILSGTTASGGFVNTTPTRVTYFNNADSSLDDWIKYELENKLGESTETHIVH